MSEPWEAYYAIYPSVPKGRRDTIIASLRVITAADGGMELMRQGFEMNGSQPVTITNVDSSHSEATSEGINLSFDETARSFHEGN